MWKHVAPTLPLAFASIAMLVPDRAEACSCAVETVIVEPAGGEIPAAGRVLGRAIFSSLAGVALTYVDDASQTPIPGTLDTLGPGGVITLWTFTPSAPLEVGRTVHVAATTNGGSSATKDLLVVDDAVPGPPTFAGVTGLRAVRSTLHIVVGDSCSPQEGAVQDRLEIQGLPAPSASAPIYRYYVYESPGARPTTPTGYGIEGYYDDTMACGNATLRCRPWLSVNLTAGGTVCVRVEAEDLAGRRSGYDAEACATVVEESVDYVSQFPNGICVARDAGVAPDTGANEPDTGLAGLDTGVAPGVDTGVAPADTGTSPTADSGTDDHADAGAGDATPRVQTQPGDDCSCVEVPGARGSGSALALLGAAIIAGALRRSRPSSWGARRR